MTVPARPPVADTEIFTLSPHGHAELKSAGTSLSAHELEVLVLVDGRATVAQIAKSARGLAPGEVAEAIRKLAGRHLIASIRQLGALETEFLNVTIPPGLFGEANAHPETEQGVSSLQQAGYYVRIARRAAQKREVQAGWKPTILVVDDDPDLQKLLRTYFRLEGFETREAATLAEITTALRQPPMPDLVLLDVALPDADGFDILARMRQHALLKSMPVIMITAQATRGAVLKGLQAGADGYITKPFEPDWVVTAVNEVLGLHAGKPG
jgi:two-component system OmpR family response regulator